MRSIVDGQHQQGGNEKSDDGGGEHVTRLKEQRLALAALVILANAKEAQLMGNHGRKGNQRGGNPYAEDDKQKTTSSVQKRVTDRLRDGQISIECDGTEVENAGRARKVVQRLPQFAPECTELPLRADRTDHTERHDDQRNEQIGHGKAEHKVFGGKTFLKASILEEDTDEQQIGNRRSDRQRDQQRIDGMWLGHDDRRRRRRRRKVGIDQIGGVSIRRKNVDGLVECRIE